MNKMKTANVNLSNCDEFKVCRCCLCADDNILSLDNRNDFLLEMFTGTEPHAGSENWLCPDCAQTIRRISSFKEVCRRAGAVLDYHIDQRQKGKFDLERFKEECNKVYNQAQPSFSNAICIGVTRDADSAPSQSHTLSVCEDDVPNNRACIMTPVVKATVKVEMDDEFEAGDDADYEEKLDNNNVDKNESGDLERTNDDVGISNKNLQVKEEGTTRLCDVKKEEEEEIPVKKCVCEYCCATFPKLTLLRHRKHCRRKRKLSLKNVITTPNIVEKIKTTFVSKAIKNKKKRSLTCKECCKVFQLPCLLKRHLIIHSNEKPFSCLKCVKTFRRDGDLKKHTHIVHSGVKPFICDVCGDSFSLLGTLNNHSLRHTGVKKFSCEECGKSFKLATELKRHNRVHSGEKPFTCEVCGHAFALGGNLKTHRRIHTGERPYKCNICGNTYTEAGYLKKHKRIHSGERPYPCGFCSQSFSTSCGLKTHTMIHTGEKPFCCGECGYSTNRSQHLKRHKKTHSRDKTVK